MQEKYAKGTVYSQNMLTNNQRYLDDRRARNNNVLEIPQGCVQSKYALVCIFLTIYWMTHQKQ